MCMTKSVCRMYSYSHICVVISYPSEELMSFKSNTYKTLITAECNVIIFVGNALIDVTSGHCFCLSVGVTSWSNTAVKAFVESESTLAVLLLLCRQLCEGSCWTIYPWELWHMKECTRLNLMTNGAHSGTFAANVRKYVSERRVFIENPLLCRPKILLFCRKRRGVYSDGFLFFFISRRIRKFAKNDCFVPHVCPSAWTGRILMMFDI